MQKIGNLASKMLQVKYGFDAQKWDKKFYAVSDVEFNAEYRNVIKCSVALVVLKILNFLFEIIGI